MSKYLNDPREDVLRTESGVGYYLEEDKREENENDNWCKWGARVLDLCDLPVDEYMKPMTVNVNGGGGGGGEDTGSTTTKYTLKYYVNNQLMKTYSNLEEGDALPEYSAEMEGYDVTEWADADGVTYQTMPAKNLKLYCTRTIKSFTVRFLIDNELISSGTVEYNQYATAPSTQKTGYTFSGWEPDVNNTKITGDTNFTGSYTVNTYTLTWVINGNTTTEQYDYGETIIYPEVSIEGYTFSGWTNYQETMPARDITIEAILIPDTPVGPTDFYYGSKLNSELTGSLNHITSGMVNAEISSITPSTKIDITIPTAESLGLADEYEEYYDEDDEFTENWDASYAFSLVLVAPVAATVNGFRQGDTDAPNWAGNSRYETNYGTVTINGNTYNVFGYRNPNTGYIASDGSPLKTVYIDIE